MENINNFFLNLADAIRQGLIGLGLSDGLVEALMAGIGVLGIVLFSLLNVMIFVWLERRISALMQFRLGPNRNGPWGLMQSMFDAIKLLTKEDIIPRAVDKKMFIIGNLFMFVPTVLLFAVVPFGEGMIAVDLNIGIFYYIAISSTATLAVLMAGWGSNNKWSLLGGMRGVAQMISYEIPLAFSILAVVMLVGSLKMTDIVAAQENVWFVIPQFVAFIVFLIAGTAELNRAPFDMPEAEQELTAGFFTEYTGMRWALFMLAEYANMIALSGIATTLFLGGWSAPFGLTFIPGYVWFMIKIYLFVLFFMWVRWTLPRLRVDHLMGFCWKFLIPVSIANVLLTGFGIYLYKAIGW